MDEEVNPSVHLQFEIFLIISFVDGSVKTFDNCYLYASSKNKHRAKICTKHV